MLSLSFIPLRIQSGEKNIWTSCSVGKSGSGGVSDAPCLPSFILLFLFLLTDLKLLLGLSSAGDVSFSSSYLSAHRFGQTKYTKITDGQVAEAETSVM